METFWERTKKQMARLKDPAMFVYYMIASLVLIWPVFLWGFQKLIDPGWIRDMGIAIAMLLALVGCMFLAYKFVKTENTKKTLEIDVGHLDEQFQQRIKVIRGGAFLMEKPPTRYVEFLFWIFNCCNSIVQLSNLKGSVRFNAIPLLGYSHLTTDKSDIQPGQEFRLIIQLQIDEEQFRSIQETVSGTSKGDPSEFIFDEVQLMVCRNSDGSQKRLDLPALALARERPDWRLKWQQ
jgi:hypothetical protein